MDDFKFRALNADHTYCVLGAACPYCTPRPTSSRGARRCAARKARTRRAARRALNRFAVED